MQGRGRGRFRPGGPTARGRGRHVWPGHQQEASNRAVPEREDAPRLTAAYARAASTSAKLSHKMPTARDSSAASVVEIEPNITAVNTDSLRLISEALILSTGSPHAPIALANTNTEFRFMMRPVLVDQVVLGVRNDRDVGLDIDKHGLVCKSKRGDAWAGARCGMGVTEGVGYFEAKQIASVTIMSGGRAERHSRPGIMRVGWSARAALLRGNVVVPTRELGVSAMSFGYGGTAKKCHDGKFTDYGLEFSDADVIGCILDRVNRTVSFSRNGIWLGVAFHLPLYLSDIMLHPAIFLKGCTAQLNLGATPFLFSPPRGYNAPYPLTIARTSGTVSKWDSIRAIGFITSRSGQRLFCHVSNIVDGDRLQPGTQVDFAVVKDHAQGTQRAEQISGGVTAADDMDKPLPTADSSLDKQLIARQQAEIEALRQQLAELSHHGTD